MPFSDVDITMESFIQYCEHLVQNRFAGSPAEDEGRLRLSFETRPEYRCSATGTLKAERNSVFAPVLDLAAFATGGSGDGPMGESKAHLGSGKSDDITADDPGVRAELWRRVRDEYAPMYTGRPWCIWVTSRTRPLGMTRALQAIPTSFMTRPTGTAATESRTNALVGTAGDEHTAEADEEACGGAGASAGAGASTPTDAAKEPAAATATGADGDRKRGDSDKPWFNLWHEIGMVFYTSNEESMRKLAAARKTLEGFTSVALTDQTDAAQREDLRKLFDVTYRCFPVAEGEEDRLGVLALFCGRLIDERVVQVVGKLDDGSVVGGGMALMLTGESEGDCVVCEVCVDHKYRRRGFAKAIMVAIMEMAIERGAQRIVLQSGELGRATYIRVGFEEVCRMDVLEHS